MKFFSEVWGTFAPWGYPPVHAKQGDSVRFHRFEVQAAQALKTLVYGGITLTGIAAVVLSSFNLKYPLLNRCLKTWERAVLLGSGVAIFGVGIASFAMSVNTHRHMRNHFANQNYFHELDSSIFSHQRVQDWEAHLQKHNCLFFVG